MKYLKNFESYVIDTEPLNFEEVFGFSSEELSNRISDFIDKYDFIGFEISSEDYKKFKIEFYDKDFSTDPTQDLSEEYESLKEILPGLKDWFDSYFINMKSHKFDKERNRIVIECELSKN
jgi:uncharacterized protein YutD